MRLSMLNEGLKENTLITLLKSVVRGTEYEGKVFIAGGYVRDEILGKKSKDIDLVINLTDGGIKFAKYLAEKLGIYKEGSNPVVYERFGTAKVSFDGVTHNDVDLTGLDVECVAPRQEKYNSDSRNPVTTAGTLKQDVERRDFTVNSLLKNLSTDEVEDLTGLGVEDIKAGILRTPLDPEVIFSDDPLRMLRAVRFAVKYGWQFAPGLEQALTQNAHRMSIISKERVRDELEKMLISPDPKRAIQIMMDTGLIEHIHPKLADALRQSVGMTQNRYHKYDVYGHILEVVANSSPGVPERLAALLHDIGKPATRKPHAKNDGEYSFIGHEDDSMKLATEILTDLKFPTATIDHVVSAVGAHMSMKTPKDATDKSVRKWVRGVVGSHAAEAAAKVLDTAIDLLRADAMGHQHTGEDPGDTSFLKQRIAAMGASEPKQMKQDLVTGTDLMAAFNLQPGPKLKEMKNFVQDLIDGDPSISKEAAMQAVKDRFSL